MLNMSSKKEKTKDKDRYTDDWLGQTFFRSKKEFKREHCSLYKIFEVKESSNFRSKVQKRTLFSL